MTCPHCSRPARRPEGPRRWGQTPKLLADRDEWGDLVNVDVATIEGLLAGLYFLVTPYTRAAFRSSPKAEAAEQDRWFVGDRSTDHCTWIEHADGLQAIVVMT